MASTVGACSISPQGLGRRQARRPSPCMAQLRGRGVGPIRANRQTRRPQPGMAQPCTPSMRARVNFQLPQGRFGGSARAEIPAMPQLGPAAMCTRYGLIAQGRLTGATAGGTVPRLQWGPCARPAASAPHWPALPRPPGAQSAAAGSAAGPPRPLTHYAEPGSRKAGGATGIKPRRDGAVDDAAGEAGKRAAPPGHQTPYCKCGGKGKLSWPPGRLRANGSGKIGRNRRRRECW